MPVLMTLILNSSVQNIKIISGHRGPPLLCSLWNRVQMHLLKT